MAPSVSGEDVPAVTLPSAWKAGLSAARPSAEVAGRRQPSRSITTSPTRTARSPPPAGRRPAPRRRAAASRPRRLLPLARDPVPARDVLGGLAHRHVDLRVALDEAGVREEVEADHRHARHRLGAACHVRLAHPHRDRAGRGVDGLHRRAAEAVDRGAGDGAGSPASTPTMRPTFIPCSASGNAHPMVTSSIASGATPVCSTSARTTWPPSSSGRSSRSSPRCARTERRPQVARDHHAIVHAGAFSARSRRTGVVQAGSLWAVQ